MCERERATGRSNSQTVTSRTVDARGIFCRLMVRADSGGMGRWHFGSYRVRLHPDGDVFVPLQGTETVHGAGVELSLRILVRGFGEEAHVPER